MARSANIAERPATFAERPATFAERPAMFARRAESRAVPGRFVEKGRKWPGTDVFAGNTGRNRFSPAGPNP